MIEVIEVSKNIWAHSPKTDEELQDYVDSLPVQDRATAYIVMGMTWNRSVDKLSKLSFDNADIKIDSADEVLWVTVGNISVRIVRSDEGAICDMYTEGVEDLDDAHLSSCYAFFSEATVSDEGEEDHVEGHPV